MQRENKGNGEASEYMLPDPPTKLKPKVKDTPRKSPCPTSNSSTLTSQTQFNKSEKYHPDVFKTVTRHEFYGKPDSTSGSSDSYDCFHGKEERQYTKERLLRRNLVKNLDSVPVNPKWIACPPELVTSTDLAQELAFLVSDPACREQVHRIRDLINNYAKASESGFLISDLDIACLVMEYLICNQSSEPIFKSSFELMLQNIMKPVRLKLAMDCITYFESLRSYLTYLGYLLMCLEDEDHFRVVSQGVIYQLSAPDHCRGKDAVKLHQALAAAVPSLTQIVARMVAVAGKNRFLAFVHIALLLGFDSADNCISMMKENMLENIFYRFNPYFPDKNLPFLEINPRNPSDKNLKLGDSSINISTTLSLLLVLVAATKKYVAENPKVACRLPCPDDCSQNCFIWAYRYECRAPEHRHERNTLTVILNGLLHCFKDRLNVICNVLMADVMSLSVVTEVPPRGDWIDTVPFNTCRMDVIFKKLLIFLSIDFLKICPINTNPTVQPYPQMVETRHWILGLMYLLDPGLCPLRAKWSASHITELKKTSFQALSFALPLTPPHLVKEYGLVRRLLWYIEWYSEMPYELPLLYWCIRLLHAAMCQRMTLCRKLSVKNLLNTHGVIILMRLCQTLLDQKSPPVERSQAIIGLTLRILTTALEVNTRVKCCVYTEITWPATVNQLARKMLDMVLTSLEKSYIISDRWLIPLLNIIWQAIIWKADFRALFIKNNGLYKLLDLITMVKSAVQCLALALICDVARAGEAAGQLVTWRARPGASNANPVLVKRGSTIAALLAAVFRDECRAIGVKLSDKGIIEDLSVPLLAFEVRREMSSAGLQCGYNSRTIVTLAAAEMAGSRMSKAYTILHLLSEDLEFKVSLLDETYKLYKNVELSAEDEVSLVLCSHYLTVKLNESWSEVDIHCPELLPQDANTLREFLEIGKGWGKEIQRQQEAVLEVRRKKDIDAESSLYAFLGRVRLNTALDALREVRCISRASDRVALAHALLYDAVRALQRRANVIKRLDAPVIKTYASPLDDTNITGQHKKVVSTFPKDIIPTKVITPTSQECKDRGDANIKVTSRARV